MRNLILAALAVVMLAVPAGAKNPVKAAKPAALKCPVTGETIASKAKAAGSSVYKGKTYYFCCGACKPAFDANPAKYVKSAK